MYEKILKELIESYHIKQTTIAKELNCGSPFVSRMYHGGKPIPQDKGEKLVEMLKREKTKEEEINNLLKEEN